MAKQAAEGLQTEQCGSSRDGKRQGVFKDAVRNEWTRRNQ